MKILIDTSVWIEFFKGVDSKENKRLKKCITEREDVYLTPIIIQEILQGIRDDKQYGQIKNHLLLFDLVESSLATHVFAANIYRTLRKRGITVPSSIDCLIAAIALQNDLFLLHKDRDFVSIAQHFPLKVVSV